MAPSAGRLRAPTERGRDDCDDSEGLPRPGPESTESSGIFSARPTCRSSSANIRFPGTPHSRPARSFRPIFIQPRTNSSTCSTASRPVLEGRELFATTGDLIRLPMNIPHGLFNKSDQTVKCFFWVTPRPSSTTFLGHSRHERAVAARRRGALPSTKWCSCRRPRNLAVTLRACGVFGVWSLVLRK